MGKRIPEDFALEPHPHKQPGLNDKRGGGGGGGSERVQRGLKGGDCRGGATVPGVHLPEVPATLFLCLRDAVI